MRAIDIRENSSKFIKQGWVPVARIDLLVTGWVPVTSRSILAEFSYNLGFLLEKLWNVLDVCQQLSEKQLLISSKCQYWSEKQLLIYLKQMLDMLEKISNCYCYVPKGMASKRY